MLILSWNVAGLSTTANRIYENYRTTTNSTIVNNNNEEQEQREQQQQQQKKSKIKPNAVISNFFTKLHNADIICIQEHKISKNILIHRSEPLQIASWDNDNYESFWSCCTDTTKKGLNGVVTYAKHGTVISANSTPLECTELDEQGRCVMTDHGTFVLFNVYVPNTGGQPLRYKMKFLNALRNAMNKQRQLGKAVILVGDLNISYTKYDIYWKDRVVFVNDILKEIQNDTTNNKETSLPQWKRDIANHWNKIETALRTKTTIPVQTTNPATGEKYNKFRTAVTVTTENNNNNNNNSTRHILLGQHESIPDYCLYRYDFLENKTYQDEDSDEHILCQEANTVRVSVLTELMSKIAGVVWTEETQRHIANNHADVERVAPARKWLHAIIEEDGMIDAFRYFYPNAQARFTCWNQNKNCRYSNDGARIDYTLIDKSLLPLLQQGESGLRVADVNGDCMTEQAALAAATSLGRFEPVSFEGGGMQQAPKAALDSQFGPAHTGHIYTPPTFSDHIGVSVLLNMPDPDPPLILANDCNTRKAQPHKKQKTIASFFKTGTTTTTCGTKNKNSALENQNNNVKRIKNGVPVAAAKKKIPPKNSVLHHFRKAEC